MSEAVQQLVLSRAPPQRMMPAARLSPDIWLSISPELKELAADTAILAPVEAGPRLLADQQMRWRRGERVPAEIYLDLCIDWADERLTEALVRAELRERLVQEEGLAFDKLLERFPQYLISLQEERTAYQEWTAAERAALAKARLRIPPPVQPDRFAGRATLQRLLEPPTRFEPEKAAAFVAQLAKLAGTLHRKGHCPLGIEPARIALAAAEGTLNLAADAGELLISGSHTPLGNAVYDVFMSPELLGDEELKVGPRSDVYSLGAVLFFLATGRLPPRGRAPQQDAAAESTDNAAASDFAGDEALQAASVPDDLQRICRRAMAFDPAERYASADDLATDLEVFRSQPAMLTHCLAPGLAALAIFAGIALAGWLWNTGWFG